MSRRRTGVAAAEPLSKDRLRLWIRILKISRRVEGELRNRLREGHDTTLPRFDVLAALYRDETGLRMSDLSHVLMVSNGNVTGIVDRLAEEGLLTRLPDEDDRRATIVRLTKQGRAYFARLAAVHEGWVDGLLAGLDRRDTAELLGLLTRLGRNIDGSTRPK